MSRRVSLPAADDLFRPTATPTPAPAQNAPEEEPPAAATERETGERSSGGSDRARGHGHKGRQPSGRVRHDEKMTVYVTSDELLDLEHARLLLRRHHDLAVDRGRIVRAAVALALADLETRGEDSLIVQRLKQT